MFPDFQWRCGSLQKGNKEYTPAGGLYRLMDDEAKGRLIANTVDAMQSVPREIQLLQIGRIVESDPTYYYF